MKLTKKKVRAILVEIEDNVARGNLTRRDADLEREAILREAENQKKRIQKAAGKN